ncbi:MAG: Xaa-Pro peptidase family protein [Gaiellaceae bacterium]
MSRLERLQATLERPLLVTSQANVRYLSGYRGLAALLVEPHAVRLLTDSRFTGEARAATGLETVEVERGLFGGMAAVLEGEICVEAESLTVAQLETLQSGSAELVSSSGLVEALREVKDESELAAIRRASDLTSEAYRRLAAEPFCGRRELDLAWRMHELFHELGAEGDAFPTIVASGPNGAYPHAEPTERVVQSGDLIVVDAGAAVGGYNSDCTRTFACGEISAELRRAYDVCLAAQEAGVAAVRAGALAGEVDALARDLVEASEFAGHFLHGLGHGVGIEVHEAPMLNTAAGETTLQAGNVVTVEPGIYLEGRGGVRIEDLLVVTENGAEVLTTFPKELVTVG